jgi:hypothetical protein
MVVMVVLDQAVEAVEAELLVVEVVMVVPG